MSLSSSMRLFLAALAVAALSGLAVADTITFTAPNITLSESQSVQTGYFDVVISDTANATTATSSQGGGNGGNLNTTGTDAVNGFDLEVDVNGPITFLGGSDLTAANNPQLASTTYIFSTNSTDDPSQTGAGTNLTDPSGPVNQNQQLTDSSSGLPVNLAQGTPLGLIQVEYSVPAGYVGTVTLSLPDGNANPAYGAIFLDSTYNPDIPALVNGSITVVPEPSSVVMLILGAVGLFGIRRMRARG